MEYRSSVNNQVENTHTPLRRRDEAMTRSQFLHNSVRNSRNSINPEDVLRTFFMDQPFQKFQKDITRYRPISYESPNKSAVDRDYVIVDEKVSYGKPISADQFQRVRRSSSVKHSVVTYGVGKDRTRLPIDIQKDKARATCGCCAGCGACCGNDKDNEKLLVQKYE